MSGSSLLVERALVSWRCMMAEGDWIGGTATPKACRYELWERCRGLAAGRPLLGGEANFVYFEMRRSPYASGLALKLSAFGQGASGADMGCSPCAFLVFTVSLLPLSIHHFDDGDFIVFCVFVLHLWHRSLVTRLLFN